MREAESLRPFQRGKKITCMDYLCFKSTLFDALNRARRRFPTLPTFLIPRNMPELQRFHAVACGRGSRSLTWVIKPRNGSCGRGVFLLQSAHEVAGVERLMVERLLLDGVKFDFRFFLLVASLDPFAAFIYGECIAHVCTGPYPTPTRSTRGRALMNLTNTVVSARPAKAPDEYTRPASEVLARLEKRHAGAAGLWGRVCGAARMLLASLYPAIAEALPGRPLRRPPPGAACGRERPMTSAPERGRAADERRARSRRPSHERAPRTRGGRPPRIAGPRDGRGRAGRPPSPQRVTGARQMREGQRQPPGISRPPTRRTRPPTRP